MNIHFILQSKGGVGKSFIATMFTQFFIHRGMRTKSWTLKEVIYGIYCPANQGGFKAL